MMVSKLSLLQRLMRHVSPEPNSGCFIWLGASSNGYGQIKVNRKTQKAHRVFYELLIGPIPEGLDLDHLCHVRCCVNPKHLEPVTRQINMNRAPYYVRHNRWTKK